jgi:hypothetical protein
MSAVKILRSTANSVSLPTYTGDLLQMLHNQPFSTTSTHTLMYRGLSYTIPNHQPVKSLEHVDRSIGKRLVYRGVPYEPNSAMVRETLATQIRKRLFYRNVAYFVNVMKQTGRH